MLPDQLSVRFPGLPTSSKLPDLELSPLQPAVAIDSQVDHPRPGCHQLRASCGPPIKHALAKASASVAEGDRTLTLSHGDCAGYAGPRIR